MRYCLAFLFLTACSTSSTVADEDNNGWENVQNPCHSALANQGVIALSINVDHDTKDGMLG